MKKLMLVALALFVLVAFSASAGADCKCPAMVKGAKVEVKNVEKGVTITITADDPAAVKEIQDKGAAIGAAGGCPCKKGDAAGCPCAKGDCGGKGQGKAEGKCPMMQGGGDPMGGGSCNCPMMQGEKK